MVLFKALLEFGANPDLSIYPAWSPTLYATIYRHDIKQIIDENRGRVAAKRLLNLQYAQ